MTDIPFGLEVTITEKGWKGSLLIIMGLKYARKALYLERAQRALLY